jgi:hypothetical protein
MDELEEFREQISIKRHEEILNALAKSIDTRPLEALIEKNTETLNIFIEKLKEINKDRPIDVTVENNQEGLLEEIKSMTKELKEGIENIKPTDLEPLLTKKEEWTFDIKRNSQGFIETVIARETLK